ncbi:MAG TPA: type II toxin-antitoxin system VapC family toxin [Solirubrobacteraceae bacterium]
MTDVLLDTRAILLWTTRADTLSDRVRRLLADRRTRPTVSAASVWELSIKQRSGKLSLPESYVDTLLSSQIRFLAVSERDGRDAGQLPLHHRDPFDRMLIAQARREGLPIIGSDAMFGPYDVEVIRR